LIVALPPEAAPRALALAADALFVSAPEDFVLLAVADPVPVEDAPPDAPDTLPAPDAPDALPAPEAPVDPVVFVPAPEATPAAPPEPLVPAVAATPPAVALTPLEGWLDGVGLLLPQPAMSIADAATAVAIRVLGARSG
jgi:hypothetical protein